MKTIKKVKLKGQTLVIGLVEKLPDNTERKVNYPDNDQLFHPDAGRAMKRLIPHLALLCDLRESDGISEENLAAFEADGGDQLYNISIDSFAVSGSADNEGITIFGDKLFLGESIPLETSCIDSESEYQFYSQLLEAIEACRFEAAEYLFNNKYAIVQQELPFSENDPDSDEFNQEAANTAGAILGEIGENILKETGAESVKITMSSSKKRNKKDNVVQFGDTKMAEAF